MRSLCIDFGLTRGGNLTFALVDVVTDAAQIGSNPATESPNVHCWSGIDPNGLFPLPSPVRII